MFVLFVKNEDVLISKKFLIVVYKQVVFASEIYFETTAHCFQCVDGNSIFRLESHYDCTNFNSWN